MMVNINRLFLINKKNKIFNFFYSAEKTMKNKIIITTTIIIIIKEGGSSLFKENGMRKILTKFFHGEQKK